MPADPEPRREGRWGRWVALAAVLATGLVGAANAHLIARSRDSVIADFSKMPACPYAMVLGTHVFPGGVPSRELAARLETGRQLYRAGWPAGSSSPGWPNRGTTSPTPWPPGWRDAASRRSTW